MSNAGDCRAAVEDGRAEDERRYIQESTASDEAAHRAAAEDDTISSADEQTATAPPSGRERAFAERAARCQQPGRGRGSRRHEVSP
jgi:hypothetical protein